MLLVLIIVGAYYGTLASSHSFLIQIVDRITGVRLINSASVVNSVTINYLLLFHSRDSSAIMIMWPSVKYREEILSVNNASAYVWEFMSLTVKLSLSKRISIILVFLMYRQR